MIYLFVYALIGLAVTEMANIGHKRIYGEDMEWWLYPIGILFWPIILFIRS